MWVFGGGINQALFLHIMVNKKSALCWKPGLGGITRVERGITGTPRTN